MNILIKYKIFKILFLMVLIIFKYGILFCSGVKILFNKIRIIV